MIADRPTAERFRARRLACKHFNEGDDTVGGYFAETGAIEPNLAQSITDSRDDLHARHGTNSPCVDACRELRWLLKYVDAAGERPPVDGWENEQLAPATDRVGDQLLSFRIRETLTFEMLVPCINDVEATFDAELAPKDADFVGRSIEVQAHGIVECVEVTKTGARWVPAIEAVRHVSDAREEDHLSHGGIDGGRA